jgi:hypothetical protein
MPVKSRSGRRKLPNLTSSKPNVYGRTAKTVTLFSQRRDLPEFVIALAAKPRLKLTMPRTYFPFLIIDDSITMYDLLEDAIKNLTEAIVSGIKRYNTEASHPGGDVDRHDDSIANIKETLSKLRDIRTQLENLL